jgi:hypothetical protein
VKRSQSKQPTTLTHRLAQFGKAHRDAADKLAPSPERDELMKKVNQAETASQIDRWVNSPGLQPPTK